MIILYSIYNLIYQVLSLTFLFFANTYLNNFFIPNSLKWEDGKLREDLKSLAVAQSTILIIEAVLLMLLMFYINNKFLSNTAKVSNANEIAKWTAGAYLVITLAFIGFVIYASFK
jgi:hypothetical protein